MKIKTIVLIHVFLTILIFFLVYLSCVVFSTEFNVFKMPQNQRHIISLSIIISPILGGLIWVFTIIEKEDSNRKSEEDSYRHLIDK